MLTDASGLVLRAREAGVGVAAFNGITLEHGEAIVAAAERSGTAVILALATTRSVSTERSPGGARVSGPGRSLLGADRPAS